MGRLRRERGSAERSPSKPQPHGGKEKTAFSTIDRYTTDAAGHDIKCQRTDLAVET